MTVAMVMLGILAAVASEAPNQIPLWLEGL
jgi:hypothetical protein